MAKSLPRRLSSDISVSVGFSLLAVVVDLWPTSHDRLKIKIKGMVATKTSPKHGMRQRSDCLN